MQRSAIHLSQLPIFSEMESEILEAYLRVCYRKGPDLVTLQTVAKEAHVAFGSVRYYFAGKENFNLSEAALLYVLQSAYQEMADWLQKSKKQNARERSCSDR